MPEGHGRFAVLNRTGNPLAPLVLRSPFHSLSSSNLALLTVTGRQTGHEHTFPVAYEQDGDKVTITVGSPEHKRWWRTEQPGAPVQIRLRGTNQTGHGLAHGTEATGVQVTIRLEPT